MGRGSAFDYGLESFLGDSKIAGRVGLVTNATGLDRNGVHVAERMAAHPRLRLVRLFSPEHGFWSSAPDGASVEHAVHPTLGIPIVSLYGSRKTLDVRDLDDLDMLVYDIQDVGVRFYTYISTLRNVIDAAGGTGMPVHILDRPNPIGGCTVEGPTLTSGFESFVGHLAIPLRYGLTPGELALWYCSSLSKPPAIKVWECTGYRRSDPFSALGVPWNKPSPSMPFCVTAAFYPGTCLFEGLNASEGRGTEAPFQILGAPWVDSENWLLRLRPHLPEGITAVAHPFRPTFGTFEGCECRGICLIADSPSAPREAVRLGLDVVQSLMCSHPGKVAFPPRPTGGIPFFDFLAGNAWVREGLLAGISAGDLALRANAEAARFSRERERFFLYD